MFIFNLIILFPILNLVQCASINKSDEGTLIFLNVIFRHGARTTYSFYPNDPYKNETFYPYGLGALTNEGKLGEYKLGQFLKNLYGDFLGEDYTEDKVYVRSTDVTRTQTSAQLVVAGLFPPTEKLMWHPELQWQPIPILYKPGHIEDIFHRRYNCPYKDSILNDLPNTPTAYEKFLKPYAELYEYIEKHSGKQMSTPTDAAELFFNLKCEADMGYKLPAWTESIFPEKLQVAAGQVYGYFNHVNDITKINSGYHIKKILEDCEQKAINTIFPRDRKLMLYSGHESTVGLMLNALKVGQPEIPNYGSAILFELRKLNNKYFIKIRYHKNSGEQQPTDLKIPSCDVMCPFHEFKRLQKHILPIITIEEACRPSSVDNDKLLF